MYRVGHGEFSVSVHIHQGQIGRIVERPVTARKLDPVPGEKKFQKYDGVRNGQPAVAVEISGPLEPRRGLPIS